MRRVTTEDFIARAKAVHGDKYDYSKVNYVSTNTKVCIIDKTHGEFWMSPHNHLKGQGHPEEKRLKQKKLIYGVGINDVNDIVNGDRCYTTWRGMFQRCYSPKWLKRYPSIENLSPIVLFVFKFLRLGGEINPIKKFELLLFPFLPFCLFATWQKYQSCQVNSRITPE